MLQCVVCKKKSLQDKGELPKLFDDYVINCKRHKRFECKSCHKLESLIPVKSEVTKLKRGDLVKYEYGYKDWHYGIVWEPIHLTSLGVHDGRQALIEVVDVNKVLSFDCHIFNNVVVGGENRRLRGLDVVLSSAVRSIEKVSQEEFKKNVETEYMKRYKALQDQLITLNDGARAFLEAIDKDLNTWLNKTVKQHKRFD